MADTTRITVTVPTELVAELRKLTDDVSGYAAEAVARRLRHQLLGADLRHHQEELAEARSRIYGDAQGGGSAGTA
ncbi:type II toxin-antitoxin system CcdA family antitoxin [Streptomyces pseudogriseolus]|uniref:type II toxin-antitoxin system CcdA family antitoxin n=1 Tax=Streptomyces pseudogriseolus TaxID=36817 RepID=UPI003485B045